MNATPTQCSLAEYISRQLRRMRLYAEVEPSRARSIRFFLMRWVDDHAPDYPEFQHSLQPMMDRMEEDRLVFTLLFRAAPSLADLRYTVTVVPTFGGFYTRVEGDNQNDACRSVQVRMQRWLTTAVKDVRGVEALYEMKQAA